MTREHGTIIGICLAAMAPLCAAAETDKAYHSPQSVAYAPDGGSIAVADHTAGRVVLIAADKPAVAKRIPLEGRPAGLVWTADGKSLYVAEQGAGTVARIDAATGKVASRIAVGRYPVGVGAGAGRLVVANTGIGLLSVVDLASGKEAAKVDCVYRPWGAALTPDGKTALVGNFLPLGDAREPTMSAAVTLVDAPAGRKIRDITLPSGSINVRGIAVSPDGKYAYVVHSVGRFTLPTTQLERGWVMTHGMSILDLASREHLATVLLDYLMEGAADPWDIVLSGDGATAWISLAGVHQVAKLDLGTLHKLIQGRAGEDVMDRLPGNSIWREIGDDPERRADLVNELTALYTAGVIRRVDVPVTGPRGLAVSPDGKTLAVTGYFSGDVVFLDANNLAPAARVALGEQPNPTPERLGEQHFFDARLCFQKWLSCASCHPEGRADALNWDLLNDGMGNPKNTKSLVFSHRTPPVMSTGVRPDMESATQKGFMFIQFRVVKEEHMAAVRAYIRSLRPEPSPFLVNKPGAKLACGVCHHETPKGKMTAAHMPIRGALTPEAEKGLKLFKDPAVGCIKCHSGPLFTDRKTHDVGTRGELDRRDGFDNPTSYGLWRTAPYLHDGAAPTLESMLTEHNKKDKHGKTSQLKEEEIHALVQYLLSL